MPSLSTLCSSHVIYMSAWYTSGSESPSPRWQQKHKDVGTSPFIGELATQALL